MPTDPVLAAVHYRVDLAGQALEAAVTTLRSTRMFRGVVEIRQAVAHLTAAHQALQASGKYPTLSVYFATLIAFYQGEVQRLFRPANAGPVADEIAANQGNLLQADPVLFPASAQ